MFRPTPWSAVTSRFLRRTAGALVLAAAVAACTGTTATNAGASATIAPTPTPTTTPIATSTATPSATDTPATPTPAATATPTAPPTTAPTNAPKPAATPTPLPPLAIGLCTGAQLTLTITSWQSSSDSYAHVTAKNASSASCSMRGSARAQILDGHGNTIADAGAAAAKVSSSDPVYTIAPNGTINTIVDWGNWCKTAPTQKLTVAMVLPFALGRIKAAANGNGPVPPCYLSAQATQVTSEAWLP